MVVLSSFFLGCTTLPKMSNYKTVNERASWSKKPKTCQRSLWTTPYNNWELLQDLNFHVSCQKADDDCHWHETYIVFHFLDPVFQSAKKEWPLKAAKCSVCLLSGFNGITVQKVSGFFSGVLFQPEFQEDFPVEKAYGFSQSPSQSAPTILVYQVQNMDLKKTRLPLFW